MALGCGSCVALAGNTTDQVPSSDQMGGWAVEAQDAALSGMGVTAEEMQKYMEMAREQGEKTAEAVKTIIGKPAPQTVTVKTDAGQSPRPDTDWTQLLLWGVGGAAAVGIGMMLFKSMKKPKLATAYNPRKRKACRRK